MANPISNKGQTAAEELNGSLVGAATGPPSTLSSLNAQLITHGWVKRPLNLDRLSEKDQAAVTTVLFEMLGSSVTNLANFDDLAARHRTLTYEHERLTRQHAQTRLSTGKMESEVQGWKSRCSELEKKCLNEENKVKELREDVARSRKALEGLKIAAGHEAKKNQIKLDKANAQLLKLSNDAEWATRRQGLTLLNPIVGSKTHPVAPQQSLLLETSVKDLADMRQSLQEETDAFRHVVVAAANTLREALAASEGRDEPPRMVHSQFFSSSSTNTLKRSITHHQASSTSHPSIADARLKSLIAEVRRRLVEGLPKRNIADSLEARELPETEDLEEKKRMEREQERIQTELEEKVKDLEVEIACVRAKEEEAQRLVDELAKQQAQERVGRKDLEDPVCDEAEYQRLREQQRRLDQDRRSFAEASARLDSQRRSLEAEKAAFHEERRAKEAEEVLALLPSSPNPSTDSGDLASISSGASDPPSSPVRQYSPIPGSSSPLSSPSYKPRTPRPASVGKKRVKTPLSRLVLEKAVRQKGKETATAHEMERLKASVLGEGGRRGNEVKGKVPLRPTAMVKSATAGGSTIGKNTLKSSVNLGTSQGGSRSSGDASTLASGSSEARRSTTLGRDLSKAGGVGPRAAAKTVWR